MAGAQRNPADCRPMTFDPMRLGWLAAILLMLIAPYALLFDVAVWRVAIVTVFEFAMAGLITWWIRQQTK